MLIVDQRFRKRLRRIMRRHRLLAMGYTMKLNSDNLLVAHPRHLSPKFPWRAMASVLIVGLVFKAFLIAALGDATYLSRLGGLSQGHALERAGAWVMQPEPVSQMVANVMRMMGV